MMRECQLRSNLYQVLARIRLLKLVRGLYYVRIVSGHGPWIFTYAQWWHPSCIIAATSV